MSDDARSPQDVEATEQTAPADAGEHVEAEVHQAEAHEAEVIEAEFVEPEEPEVVINPLAQELSDTTARLRTVSAAYRKLQEEFQDFKKRQARQLAIREEIIKGDAVSKLFEPLENLRRTIEALRRAGLEESNIEGVELVYKNFHDGFAAMGLVEIGKKGEVFSTEIHEALTMMPVPERSQDNTVVEVFDHGYQVGGRVIKPARVVVGQFVESVGEA